jgi:hypothetical protein
MLPPLPEEPLSPPLPLPPAPLLPPLPLLPPVGDCPPEEPPADGGLDPSRVSAGDGPGSGVDESAGVHAAAETASASQTTRPPMRFDMSTAQAGQY